MKGKKFLSLVISTAMTLSAFGGFALTSASAAVTADDENKTVSWFASASDGTPIEGVPDDGNADCSDIAAGTDLMAGTGSQLITMTDSTYKTVVFNGTDIEGSSAATPDGLTGRLTFKTAANSASGVVYEDGAPDRSIKFAAGADGVIDIYAKVNNGKTFTVETTDGKGILTWTNNTGASAQKKISAPVEKDKAYYLYAPGSGVDFFGVVFSADAEYVAPTTYEWNVSSIDIGKQAGDELMTGLTLVSDNSSTSNKYVTAADNGKIITDEETGAKVVTGSALKFVAYANGTLKATMIDVGSENADGTIKTVTPVIYDIAAKANLFEYTNTTAKETVELSAEVEEGKTYYIVATGTSGRFSAASFTPAGSETDETRAPEATNAPVTDTEGGIAVNGAAVTVTADDAAVTSGVLLHAKYDGAELKSVTAYPLAFAEGIAEVTVEGIEEGDKLFAWNSLDGMKPLCAAYTYTAAVEPTNEPATETASAEATDEPDNTEAATEVATKAPDDETEYTVSIGNITGGSEGDVKLVDPNTTAAPTATPEPTDPPITGLVPITESYTFIADTYTNAGTAAIAANTYFDGGKVYSEAGNSVASNKQKSEINGTEYYNSLRLKGSQNYLEFILGVDAQITVYSNIQNQEDKERATAAGTTAGGTELGHGEVGVGTFTFAAAAGTKVYLTGVNASDWTTGGDMYIAGFTVTPAAALGTASVEADGAEVLVDTLKAKAGDTITVKAAQYTTADLTLSTNPDTTITAVTDNEGYYTFTMPAADTTVNAVYESNGTLPEDILWRADDSAFDSAFGASEAKTVNGLTVSAGFASNNKKVAYTHTDGTEYTFERQWKHGGTADTLTFTPEQACIVTVIFNGNGGTGREVNVKQNGTTIASALSTDTSTAAAEVLVADIEEPANGDVVISGAGSNKNISAIFVEYYDPTKIVTRNVSGNITHVGTKETTNTKLVFTDTKDDTRYEVPISSTYSVDLRQNRTYDITVETDGVVSEDIAAALTTNRLSLAKTDKTFDITIADIALTDVEGDVVVHDINNDDTTLDLSGVTLTFTAIDTAEGEEALAYTTAITDNRLANLTMMPNHTYEVTATGADGYELSPLSKSYVMEAGDTSPFKNILFTETLGDVEFSSAIEVGADKAYATVSDAITAIKAMKDRPAGENGRVNVVIDPGTYIEQVIVDTPYVTIKAADEENKPTITFYYGIGYLYYSADGGYYSLDKAVQKTELGIVTRWGSTVRVAGQNFIAENIIFENSLNCRVTPEELADGVTSADAGWYGDVSGKPDRTVEGYDARTKAATERCAAFAGDAANYELYQCELIGSQDTLYTGNNGYFKDCYIEGGTDYIFGGNSVVFEDCTLAWHGYSDQAIGGYITACKTSSAPVAGEANLNSNGYLLKNCTITNSKYYTDNKFAAGSWGRNWGGENCQVVFDGIKLDGVDTPGAWVKMGGELSASILYVNDVTDKNGNAVNVSGTTFNPNGTMEANGYTVMDPIAYFGTWVPVHYEGAVPEKDEYTTTWYFGKSNGAASYALQGEANGTAEITATDSDNPVTQVLTVDATKGKFNNASRSDNWAQVNDGTVLSIPVVNGSKITFEAYNTSGTLSINGKSFASGETYTYNGAAGTVDAAAAGVGYMSYITVVSQVHPSEEIATPEPETTVEVTIEGLNAEDVNTVKVVGNIDATEKVFDVTDGKFSVTLTESQTYVIKGVYGGASAYVTTGADLAITASRDSSEIAVTPVTPEVAATDTVYNLGDGSVIPTKSTSYTWPSLITQDGIVTFSNIAFHDSQHGAQSVNAVKVKVPKGASTITFGGCAYAGATITAPEGVLPASASLKTDTDGAGIEFTYSGDAAELTFTIGDGSIYLHSVAVKSVTD